MHAQGGGGGGGADTGNSGSGGGGGGAYQGGAVSVSNPTAYDVVVGISGGVGAAGGQSQFGDGSVVAAGGGAGAVSGTGGAGGTAAGSAPSAFNGGAGADGTSTTGTRPGGAGGGSAGSGSIGGTASGTTAGTAGTGTYAGAIGGAAGTDGGTGGGVGNPPGAGGGGKGRAGTGTSGSGSPGRVVIIYSIPLGAPENTVLPVVTGTVHEAQTLSATTGTWTNSPDSYAYQWLRCTTTDVGSCSNISGATNSTYTLVSADGDNYIRVRVTASNAGGSTPATSAHVGPVVGIPVNSALPAISGTYGVGQTLSTSNGSWTNSPDSYSYQWRRCDTGGANCSDIGTNSSTYDLVGADAGSTIRVIVTASTAAGAGSPATSNQTPVIVSVPVNSVPPSISGTAAVTQTLTADPGTWSQSPSFTYQWRRCDPAGDNCANISGATNSTYQPVGDDGGNTIRVAVTATNAAGSDSATSNQTAVVIVAPVNTVLPAISGTPVQGNELSTTDGTWDNEPDSYSYQWRRCDTGGNNCSDIGGATNNTYTLQPGDVDSTIRVVVTATNAAGGTPATSAQTAVVVVVAGVPVNSVPPEISGTPSQGSQLSTTDGTWSNSPSSYTYQWRRCDTGGGNCADIGSATNDTYTLQAGDVGSTIRVRVTASNIAGAGTPVDSSQTVVIVAGVPANTEPPEVTGAAVQGVELSASTGTWTNSPDSYAYQWRRCDAAGDNCIDIGGATNSTYTLQAADVDDTVRVRVTATNVGGAGTPADSAQTAVVVAGVPVNSVPPSITGSAAQGVELTANPGTWTNAVNLSYAYQWRRCDAAGANCSDIGGATNSTYTLQAADVDNTVRVRVTATNAAGSSSPADSAQTAVVVAGVPVNSVPPSITGNAVEGVELTTDPGTWTNAVGLTYGYQWRRCDASGANCSDISGATSSTYTLQAADVGNSVRVRVTATNAAGSSSPADSDATAEVVSGVPVNTAPPAITGAAAQGVELSASTGTWTNAVGLTYGYQWRRCDAAGANCSDIGGATLSTYTLQAADVDNTVRVRVTATNVAGSSSPADSSQTAVVVAGVPVNTVPPAITGAAAQGVELSASTGTWTNDVALTYGYQWRRCDASGANCLDISGATNSTYTLQAADVDDTVRVRVTATNAAGASDPADSDQTAVVVAGVPVNTAPPAITGAAAQGVELSASTGTWTNTAGISYAYQWRRCDASGANCANIGGATASTYTLQAGDVDNTLRVRVTATNAAGSSSPADSAQTAVVVAGVPVNSVSPSITGQAAQTFELTANPGTWSNSAGISYAYQWLRCDASGNNCASIDGATENTYTLVGADVDNTVRVRVTATNAAGASDPATSSQTLVVVAGVPVIDTLPEVTGDAVQGVELSASTGTWTNSPASYAYQWQRCDAAGSNCALIDGATNSTYTLQAADVANTVRVRVAATNAAGTSGFANSPTTSVVVSGVPVNTVLPSITGNAAQGFELTANPGTWTNAVGLSYGYQWLRCDAGGANCSDISGATNSTYTLQAADVDNTVRVRVTATNAAGASDPATSNQTAVVVAGVPANTAPPAITGAAAQGVELSASTGTWTNTTGISYAYQWRRCNAAGAECINIAGATNSTYTLQAADVDNTVRARVTATNAAGDSTPADSDQTAVVVAGVPVNTVPPAISGNAAQGVELSASTGTWTNTTDISYAYQWRRCDGSGANCSDIGGATASTYTLQAADVDNTVRVRVTATNAAGASDPEDSAQTAIVVAGVPVNTVPPAITGNAAQGVELSASTGTWTNTTDISYAYQWRRCDGAGANCSDIGGATASTYTLQAADVDNTVRVRVTATNAAGASDPEDSAQTAVVVAGVPANSILPSISGNAAQGAELSADPGTWTNAVALSYAYQWRRCDGAGANCSDIGGATSSTYTLQAGDVDSTVRVRVTATNAAGSSSPADSDQTALVVAGVPVNSGLPSITGTVVQDEELTANPGTWTNAVGLSYAYQWLRCDTAGDNCDPIDGATSSTYTLVGGDAGSTVRVRVTATNAAGSSDPAESAQTTVVVAAAPVNTVPPVVSGAAAQGVELSTSDGSWTNFPTGFTYLWLRCNADGSGCATISGATSNTYTLAAADVGKRVRAVVTATNAAGNGTADSALTDVIVSGVPANTVPPAITGSAAEGVELSASTGTWTNAVNISYAYQWLRCDASGANCSDIGGATASTYTLDGADVGNTVRVRVTATNAAGASDPADSSQTAVVVAGVPVNSVPPSITGAAAQGVELTADPGTWTNSPTSYIYQWRRCDPTGANCANIVGATSSTYTLVGDDAGSTVRIRVTAVNAAGNSVSADSAQTAVVVSGVPVNTVLPSITGNAAQGAELTATPGTWTNAVGLSYGYQWLRCDAAGDNCSDISGATNSTYTLQAADVDDTVRVRVTATNAAGASDPATSNQTAVVVAGVPANTVPPAITGAAAQGVELSASTGTWTNTTGISYAYQWRRCNTSGAECINIAGATNSTYTLQAADVGNTVRVRVTATNAAGDSTPADSDQTAVVVAGVPANTVPPAITGNAAQGVELSASTGTWTNDVGTTFAYQWRRCDAVGDNCSDISGATNSTYTLQAADVDNTVRVRVTATNAAGASDPEDSAQTAVVVAGVPVNSGLPSISGSAAQGAELTADPGTWTNDVGTTFAYQWRRCDAVGDNCSDISGATNSTYTLQAADVDNTVRVRVTATNAAGSSTPADSAQTAVVVASAPVNTVPPSITGNAAQGQTLTASPGTWTNDTDVSYAYQWRRCDASGNNCVSIDGATSSTYLLVEADAANTIRVRVQATNAAGSDTADSAATAVVVSGVPVNTVLPEITGAAVQGAELSTSPGAWTNSVGLVYAYQWLRCDASGANCSEISGATNSTYTLQAADADNTVRARVTATNAAGTSDPAASDQTAVVVADAPENTVPPAITGNAAQGSELSATTGTWTNDPASYAYQWLRCDASGVNCSEIGGATSSTYTLQAADVDNTIRVRVTATNAAGTSDPAASDQTVVVVAGVPVNTTPPAITGAAAQGVEISASTGTWTNPVDIAYAYQWLRCDTAGDNCVSIAGATSSTYTLQAADSGNTVRARVTATNAAGSSDPATSDQTAVVVAGVPVNTVPPAITGAAAQGVELSASPGTWTNATGISYAYQWRRCDPSGDNCSDIGGATASTYTLQAADAGNTVRVRVTATNVAGSSTPADSGQTAVVVAGVPVVDTLPAITGSTIVGQQLSASTGSWTNAVGLSYAYQWLRCDAAGDNCDPIDGATSSTYTLVSADHNLRVRVAVTATNAAGSSTPAQSAPSAVVIDGVPVNVTPPQVTGTFAVGEQLSATDGTWTNSPTSFTYIWHRCDETGLICEDIAGATANTYTLVPADAGSRVGIDVTATNAAGDSLHLDSIPPNIVVANAPANTVLPSITGTPVPSQTLTVVPGTWTDSYGITYAYQWLRCDTDGLNCSNVGSNLDTYQVQEGDLGSRIRVDVTATNAAGTSTAVRSEATGVVVAGVPVNVTLPEVAGVLAAGQTLTVGSFGTWTNSPSSYTYGWARCVVGDQCTSIGTNNEAYTLQPEDAGFQFVVAVRAHNAAGQSTLVASVRTAVVVAAVPANTTPPSITGTAAVGSTLTADPGAWTEPVNVVYAYQWLRCDAVGANCSEISGATSSTYTLIGDDGDDTIRVRVTATNAAGTSAPSTSGQTAVIAASVPVNTVLPAITGAAAQGVELSASTGTWTNAIGLTYGYQWLRCDASGANCSDIGGATASTYTLQAADVGNTVRVRVTATNAAGASDPATSAQTAVVVAGVPVNTVPPAITGAAAQGVELSASTGTWTNTVGISYAYQWLRCDASGANCSDIGGATNSTYTLQATDVDDTVRVRVTATNAAGASDPEDSAQTAVVVAGVPANTVLPAITGAAAQGVELSASTGTWTNAVALSYAYQWRRCDASGANCSDISGATSSTYTLQAADVDSTVRVRMTATNAAGSSTPEDSAQTAVVVAGVPVIDVAPVVSGAAAVGADLSASAGTWTNSPTSFAYQWQRCDGAGQNCVDIGGATSATYTLVGGDAGNTVRVQVAATNAAGSSTSAPSVVTALVVAGVPVLDAAPAISGTAIVGQQLSASTGTWTNAVGLTYAYQWQRCDTAGDNCDPIGGATSSTYTLAGADHGTRVRVAVTATNAAGSSTPAQSAATAVVVDGVPVNTAVPTVSGTPAVGEQLSATNGSWTNSPVNYTYQWQRCNASGLSCVGIGGETNSTYTLVGADADNTVRVEVHGENAAGDSAPAFSVVTAVVVSGVPTNTVLPAISGTPSPGETLTSTNGTWTDAIGLTFAYQWLRCDTDGLNCTNAGSDQGTYVVQAGDLGLRMRVDVTATNAAGASVPARAASTGIVAAGVPVNLALPTMSGIVAVGQTLTGDVGTWTNDPTSFTYVWHRCQVSAEPPCDDVGSALTYTLQPADAGFKMAFGVYAHNATGTGLHVHSLPTALVVAAAPSNTTLPSITGVAAAGATLTANPGTWTEPVNVVYGYQWLRCDNAGDNCVSIGGATNSTYTLVGGDATWTIRVDVTATNAAGTSSASRSAATGVVVAGVPVNITLPVITGTAAVGSELSASTGTWTNDINLTYLYQWHRCNAAGAVCVDIAGATSSTYTLVEADSGSTIRVHVQATNAAGDSPHIDSNATPVVVGVPVNTVLPSITGTLTSGETLTATAGSWTNSPATYAYQWRRCDAVGAACADIAGATASTYTLVVADGASTIRVVVTATNAAGSAQATSTATGAVTAPPSNTASPTITGTASVGSTLTAQTGAWTGAPTFTFQWRRCEADNTGCANISGATGTTYVVLQGDVGKRLGVLVTGTNAAGSIAADWATTGVVSAGLPVNSVPPSVSGAVAVGLALSATPGTWSGSPTFTYQWQRCSFVGTNCSNLPGATSSTYQVSGSDGDATLRVVVTATNASGSASAASAVTAIVPAVADEEPEEPVEPQPPTGTIEDTTGGTTVSVPGLPSVETSVDPAQPTVVTTQVSAIVPSTATTAQPAPVFTGTTTVTVPTGAIPNASRIAVRSVANPTELQQVTRSATQNPQMAQRNGVVAAVQIVVFDGDGQQIRGDFTQPVTISVDIPADSIPLGATTDDYTLAFWNGEDWEEVPARVVSNTDGWFRLEASVTHFTLFAALYRTEQLHPVPQHSLTMSVWTGGSVDRIEANYPNVRSIWMTRNGRLYGYHFAVPGFVNRSFVAVFGDSFEPSTTMLVVRDAAIIANSDPVHSSGARAQVQGTGLLSVDPAVGVTLSIWSGGSLQDLVENYPGVGSVWLVANGRFYGYQYGVPAFVNRAFVDLFGTNLPSGTPMLVVR